MKTFYSENELNSLGIKKYGRNVLISRNAVLYAPQNLEIGDHVRIDDFTTISGNVKLGNYIHISQFCGLYGGEAGIVMEDYTSLSSRSVIYATSSDYSGEFLIGPTVPEKYTFSIHAKVHLKKYVGIGCMSTVLPGVTIGEGSTVGAMSLCNRSLDAWGIYVGIPAKRLKDRKKKVLELAQQLENELYAK